MDYAVRMPRDEWHDEIGLHFHPYCHFVEAAGLTCRTSPTYATSWRDPGYTVFCGAYTEDEFLTLLRTADALFEMNGLGKPVTFRAGGWSLEAHTLRALAADGFVADTSANDWMRLEEWAGVEGTSLYEWNRMQWASIDERSQPYWPNTEDLLSDEAPHAGVLEVPDNGILADYVTTQEMIEILDANWDGGALPEPRQLSIGYHPPSLSVSYHARIDGALDHIDQLLAVNDEGPIVYATLSEMQLVWPEPTTSARRD